MTGLLLHLPIPSTYQSQTLKKICPNSFPNSMSIAAASGLHCEVWQPEDFSETETQCSSSSSSSSSNCFEPAEFFIDFYVCSYASEGDGMSSKVRYKNFRERCDVLTQDSMSWSAISCMLSESSVPYHLQPFFIQQISIRARGIATEPKNAKCRRIPMVVEVRLPEEDLGSGERWGWMERVDGVLRIDDCVICLDEIVFDAVRMPCLHVYHPNCIHKWLQLSNRCPLCRFQMPLEHQNQ